MFPGQVQKVGTTVVQPSRVGRENKSFPPCSGSIAFRLNRSTSHIRSRILDPIWVTSHWVYVSLRQLGRAIAQVFDSQCYSCCFLPLHPFKTKFLDLYYKSSMVCLRLVSSPKQYLMQRMAQFPWTSIYFPNLISMLLISLSAPLMKPNKLKLLLKTYT